MPVNVPCKLSFLIECARICARVGLLGGPRSEDKGSGLNIYCNYVSRQIERSMVIEQFFCESTSFDTKLNIVKFFSQINGA